MHGENDLSSARKTIRDRNRKKAAALSGKAEAQKRWLDVLGLLELWNRFPPQLKRQIVKSRWPRPSLDFKGPSPDFWPAVRAKVFEEWDAMTFSPEGLTWTMPALEVLTVLFPMAILLEKRASNSQHKTGASEMLVNMAFHFGEEVVGQLEQPLIRSLEIYSRPDHRHFRAEMTVQDTGTGILESRWTVETVASESRVFVVDGKPRPGYRAAHAMRFADDGWIEWQPKALELDVAVDTLPVYVQAHAVDNVERRFALAGPDELGDLYRQMAAVARTNMLDSLAEPRIIKRNGPTLYVECRAGEYRFGYLVAEIIDSAVLVRTFLFLTMQGTPESDELRKALRLRRNDIEWIGLDSFADVVRGDIKNDPQLCDLLEECGCGSLVALAKILPDDPSKTGMSKTLRTFLSVQTGKPRPSLRRWFAQT